MRIHQLLLATAGLWVLLPGTLSGIDQTVGRITAAEGSPEIIRGARPLQVPQLLEQDVLNMDHFSLEADDIVRVELFTAGDGDARLILYGNTTTYVMDDPSRGEMRIRLRNGSIKLIADRIPRGRAAAIHVGDGTILVRGTTLQVDSRQPGEYLVTVAEGRAEVLHGSSETIIALPEQPVEHTRKNGFRAVSMSETEDVAAFRGVWRDQRDAGQLDTAREAFQAVYERADASYRELMQHQQITDMWIVEDRQRSSSSEEAVLRQTAAVSKDLQAAAAELQELERYLLSEYIPEAADEIERRMHMVRYLMALYAERNNGRLPLP